MPMIPMPAEQSGALGKVWSSDPSNVMSLGTPMGMISGSVPGSRSAILSKLMEQTKPGEEQFLTKAFGINEEKWLKSMAEDRIRSAMTAGDFQAASKAAKGFANMSKAFQNVRKQIIDMMMSAQQMGGK